MHMGGKLRSEYLGPWVLRKLANPSLETYDVRTYSGLYLVTIYSTITSGDLGRLTHGHMGLLDQMLSGEIGEKRYD